jgi:hypothetical protein
VLTVFTKELKDGKFLIKQVDQTKMNEFLTKEHDLEEKVELSVITASEVLQTGSKFLVYRIACFHAKNNLVTTPNTKQSPHIFIVDFNSATGKFTKVVEKKNALGDSVNHSRMAFLTPAYLYTLEHKKQRLLACRVMATDL